MASGLWLDVRRWAEDGCLSVEQLAAQQLDRLCEKSGLWGASPKNGIEGSKKWGRSGNAIGEFGVSTQPLAAALERRQDLRLTRLARGKAGVACLPECARMGESMPEPPACRKRSYGRPYW